MKRLLSLLLFLSFLTTSNAQSVNDAYRYSQNELSGTARFIGMSGAFGSLGGDISAMSFNPASSAVFLSSSASVSLEFRNLDNSILFNKESTSGNQNQTDLSNIGGVFVFQSNDDKNWRKFSLGINYSTMANFDEDYKVRGNSNNSVDQYFLENANGVPLDLLQRRDGESISDLYSFLGENYGYREQQAYLGYEGYIIEAAENDPDNTEYISYIQPGNFDQQYQYAATGLNGKLTFNVGAQYKDFLYLGLNLNSHFINYERASEFAEFNDNINPDDDIIETTEVYFGNTLNTNGDGFSFQLGGIAKVGDYVRLGLTYDSPTWFNIREETTQYLETNSAENEFVSVLPNIINVFPEYQLQTPSKFTGSASVLFGKQGLLSFDYTAQDYRNIKFKPVSDINFTNLNTQIDETMQLSSSYKLGGEYRFSNLSLRAGFRFEESPFKNEYRVGNLTGYSGGLGYNFGNINLDLAYSYANYEENIPIFDSGLTNPINIDRDLSKVVLSLTFGL